MRQVSRNLVILSLGLLLAGCTNFDPTRFWKYNRGDNVMNDDGYFSVPVADILQPRLTDRSTIQRITVESGVMEDTPMRRDHRKQPWQTFPFWFLMLSG